MRTKTLAQAEKILQAASHLFGAHRFHEVRMEDIAAEAGVGKGTLYRYFRDKEELYLALLAQASEQFLRQLEDAVGKETCPHRQLEAVVGACLDFFGGQPHLFDLIQRAEVMRPSGTPFPWQKARERSSALVQSIFQNAEAAGTLKLRDAEMATWLLLGGLRGIIRFGRQPRPVEQARRIVDMFLWGAAEAGQNGTAKHLARDAPAPARSRHED